MLHQMKTLNSHRLERFSFCCCLNVQNVSDWFFPPYSTYDFLATEKRPAESGRAEASSGGTVLNMAKK